MTQKNKQKTIIPIDKQSKEISKSCKAYCKEKGGNNVSNQTNIVLNKK